MSLAFPASPTVGQKYPQPAVAGVPVYTWDGEKWTTVTGPMGGILPLYTDGSNVMMGPLDIDYASPRFRMHKQAGTNTNQMTGYVGSLARWAVHMGDSVAESGGNTGSRYIISRYGDDGVFIDAPLIINRADGSINISRKTTTRAFASGSGTYTTPVGCVQIKVRCMGGGSGGYGAGGSGAGTGGSGGQTSFGTMVALPGNAVAGGGVSGSGAFFAVMGGNGGYSHIALNGTGAPGANGYFGGAGAAIAYFNAGGAASNNSGGGGAGGSTDGTSQYPGPGGGAGGYCEGYFAPGTYSWAVGAGGAGGAAGAGGKAGGNGGSGYLIIEEFYI